MIVAANDDIGNNITYGSGVQYNSTTYYQYATIKDSEYSGFMITNGSYVEYGYNKYYSFTVQFVKEPATTGAIGVGTYYMTSGREYSFPGGSSTYKVQGDPTVYHSTSFYVPSEGTYTILQ